MQGRRARNARFRHADHKAAMEVEAGVGRGCEGGWGVVVVRVGKRGNGNSWMGIVWRRKKSDRSHGNVRFKAKE